MPVPSDEGDRPDPNLVAAGAKLVSVAASRRFDNAYCWRVEFTRPSANGYTLNKTVSVICKTIDMAVAQVHRAWPDAVIIKAFRGDRWGNEGVIVVDEGVTA